MSMDKHSPGRQPSARVPFTARPGTAKHANVGARPVRVDRADSWFSIVTAVIFVLVAAAASAATVQAYGPVFLPPMNGP